MLTRFEDYAEKYDCVRMRREDGIVQITLHTNGGPILSSPDVHRELPAAFADISNDLDTLCVIMTGSGDAFWPGRRDAEPAGSRSLEDWSTFIRQGTKLVSNFLDINVPVIAAVNGPCSRHSELVVLSDIVLAAPEALLQDSPHFWNGLVPGDGVAQAWLMALGPNRGRYFLLTGQQLSAEELLGSGIVNEIVSAEELVERAWELAREIIKRPPLAIRYTKMVLARQLRLCVNDELPFSLTLEAAAHADAGGDLELLARRSHPNDGTGFARRRPEN
jgi:enoyl-CoA hydratase/carnithine racemase